jgi:hypothetical protein
MHIQAMAGSPWRRDIPLRAEPQGAGPQEASPVESWPRAARFGGTGRSAVGRLFGGGTTGNEQLTGATGLLLLVLLAILGVTILRIRPLLGPHMFLGMLLVPPVLLKLASTGYRFARYYTHEPAYREKGPPAAIPRLIAPVVVLSTVVVFASGVALLLIGPGSRRSLLPVHKLSFIVWIAFTLLHVLVHLPDLPRALRVRMAITDELAEQTAPAARAGLATPAAGRAGRALSLAGVLLAGVVLAVVYLPQFSAWTHAEHFLGAH